MSEHALMVDIILCAREFLARERSRRAAFVAKLGTIEY